VISAAGPANSLASNSSTSETVSTAKTAPAETAPPPVAVRSDSELLDNYRRRLGELFARQQEYPRIAALRGWEGEVRLRLKVARKGQLLSIHLDRSSGFEVLDQHALAMLETLASLPPLPEALEANEVQVVVPINYKLKKTT
jgi:protein TonB